ncbi:hypothetical protein GGR56DRAFT_458962 [Xylariaceae sp. FL0804]|nr:hypothetical protein GGR56DRAFT_458962 [Xylariaceae sp. FL0804]
MQTKNVLAGLLGLVAAVEASSIHRPYDRLMSRRLGSGTKTVNLRGFGDFGGFGNNNFGDNNDDGSDSTLTLNSDAVQTASASDGDPDTDAGESASAADPANFINFCSGKTLTNGLQNTDGSCNGITMGNIPSQNTMVSTVITNPQNGATLQSDQTFNIELAVSNLQAGVFTNAKDSYYSAPQDLNDQGQIIGHAHVVAQETGGSQNPTTPLDATQFAFFKGIDTAANDQGVLSAEVLGGLPAGNYRVCSMASAANHQPVVMPVAQRGAQDDCVRFSVSDSGSSTSSSDDASSSSSSSSTQNSSSSNADSSQTSKTSSDLGTKPAVTDSGNGDRPFEVEGNTFTSEADANERACSIQNNSCADLVNSGQTSASLSDCQTQLDACNSSS